MCVCVHVYYMCENVWIYYIYEEGPPQKPEVSSGGWTHCSTGFPHYVSVLGTQLYQCTSWHCCERLHLASVNFFFWRLLKSLPISWWVIYKHWGFSGFWPKNGMTTPSPRAPVSLITCSCTQVTFFLFSWMKNVPKGKHFPDVEEVKQKTAETLYIEVYEFKNCCEQWKKHLH